MMERDEIEALLPHRHPMLMVDRLVELDPGIRGVGIKEVHGEESWCDGHFPGNPIMPGVLVAEALAQVAALIYLADHREDAGQTVYLVGMDGMRFRRPVRPGDQLRLEVVKTGNRRNIWTFEGTAWVGDTRVANGRFMATLGPAA